METKTFIERSFSHNKKLKASKEIKEKAFKFCQSEKPQEIKSQETHQPHDPLIGKTNIYSVKTKNPPQHTLTRFF